MWKSKVRLFLLFFGGTIKDNFWSSMILMAGVTLPYAIVTGHWLFFAGIGILTFLVAVALGSAISVKRILTGIRLRTSTPTN